MAMKNSGGGGGGEIVQVHGGHIIRSTDRRDRHSKVFTSKGPRDRRVRLAAHTAIQFYDVQDRLGYDRPSKAVDWLISKAKNAIDKLDELPPWNPNDNNTTAALGDQPAETSSACAFQIQAQMGEEEEDSPFMPSAMDTQSIADTMKSFFPMSSGTSSMNFQGYPDDIIARNRVAQTEEDLCLSLHYSQGPSSGHHTPPTDRTTLFPGSAPVTFEPNYQRLVSWNGESREGYIFGLGSIPPPQPFLTQSSVLSQRGTLQSSFSPSVADWNEHQIHTTQAISGGQFASQGLFQFQAPMQIHGEQQHHGAVSDKPSSASIHSHH